MLGRIGSAISGGGDAVDRPVREFMGDRAQDLSDARKAQYASEYLSRYQQNAQDALDQMVDMLGKGSDRVAMEGMMAAGGSQADQVLASVARARAEKDLDVRMRRALAGTSAMDRVQQIAVYGGVAGGLTAAGQGLVALMDYMQQGQQNEADRQQPLA